jgi:HAD superfamily hydrolase (TIGR01549 family)
MLRLIGWDMDGVLIDSLSCMKSAWMDVQAKFNLHQQFSSYQRHIGKPFEVIMLEIGINNEIPDIKSYYIAQTGHYSNLITPYADVLTVFQGLRNDFISGIITSKPRERALQIVDQYHISPDFLVTPDDCSRGKPHPDPLLLVNTMFSVRPEQSLYIGDMSSDLEAASSAGWHFVHASWGYEPQVNCDIFGTKCQRPSELARIDFLHLK